MKPKIAQTLSLTLMVFLLFTWSASAAGPDGPSTTAGVDILNLGIGARASAMGNAFLSLANDATAIYWNPSGLVQLTDKQLVFSHALWLSDTENEYLAFTFPLGNRMVVGGSVMYFHMGNTLGYDEQDQPTSYFTAYDVVASLALASYLSSNLSWGLTFKGIQEGLENQKAQSWAVDLGMRYSYRRFSVGAVMRNLGSSMRFDRQSSPLPATFSSGLAVRVLDNMIITSDINARDFSHPSLSQGVEYCYGGQIYLRTGYEYKNEGSHNLSSTITTFGGGLKISALQFDYTFSSFGIMGNTHNFTFSYHFGKF